MALLVAAHSTRQGDWTPDLKSPLSQLQGSGAISAAHIDRDTLQEAVEIAATAITLGGMMAVPLQIKKVKTLHTMKNVVEKKRLVAAMKTMEKTLSRQIDSLQSEVSRFQDLVTQPHLAHMKSSPPQADHHRPIPNPRRKGHSWLQRTR